MGRVYITDEVNDTYTARVTSTGRVMVETGAAGFLALNSAQSTVSAQRVCSTPCYLKEVIVGQQPESAASLWLYDCASAGLEGLSAIATTNIIGKLNFTVGAASGAACGLSNLLPNTAPVRIPYNVYCASGLVAAISLSASSGLLGCMEGVTITYQA